MISVTFSFVPLSAEIRTRLVGVSPLATVPKRTSSGSKRTIGWTSAETLIVTFGSAGSFVRSVIVFCWSPL